MNIFLKSFHQVNSTDKINNCLHTSLVILDNKINEECRIPQHFEYRKLHFSRIHCGKWNLTNSSNKTRYIPLNVYVSHSKYTARFQKPSHLLTD